jgi:hypothetical protein
MDFRRKLIGQPVGRKQSGPIPRDSGETNGGPRGLSPQRKPLRFDYRRREADCNYLLCVITLPSLFLSRDHSAAIQSLGWRDAALAEHVEERLLTLPVAVETCLAAP